MGFESDEWMDFVASGQFGRSDGKVAFEAVWADHFWDHFIHGLVFAHNMDEAIEQGLGSTAEGMAIHSLKFGDEFIEGLSGGYTVRAAQVLLEIDGVLSEETIPALTWAMAVDIAEAMIEPHGEVIGVKEGADSLVFKDRHRFEAREDIPLGWLEILRR